MKVLLLTPEYPPTGGGAANACYYTLRELRRLGLEVDIVTSSASNAIEREHAEGGELVRLPVGKRHIHYWTRLEAVRFIWGAYHFLHRELDLRDYAVAHSYFTIPSGILTYRWRHQIPYIVSIRGSDVPGYNRRFALAHRVLRPLTKRIWRESAFVVSNSKGLRELAWQTSPDLEIKVIPNGVDTDEFYPSTEQTEHYRVRLLAVNRLIYRKGMDLLLQAMVRLRAALGDVIELEIVGEGNVQVELQHFVTSHSLSGSVSFLGVIPHDELPAVYRTADVFVLPSRAEGMSNSLLEAMAAGLPVVVTDTGGTAELVGDNGVVVPTDDVESLAAALHRLVSDAALRKRMGELSRRRAEKMNWEMVARQYAELYEQAVMEMH